MFEHGGPIDAICVTLALYGEDLDPDEITKALAVQPAASYRKGDPRRGAGQPPHRGGGWFLEAVGDAPETPDTLTRSLLQQLPPSTSEIWTQFARQYDLRIHYALYLYSFHREFSLSPELTWHLAAMRARTVFDIYASAE